MSFWDSGFISLVLSQFNQTKTTTIPVSCVGRDPVGKYGRRLQGKLQINYVVTLVAVLASVCFMCGSIFMRSENSLVLVVHTILNGL